MSSIIFYEWTDWPRLWNYSNLILVLNCLLCQIVRLHSWCQIVRGAKLSVFNSWCHIVRFTLLVPYCPFYTLGGILSVLHSWCQIVLVLNCPFLTLGAKLSIYTLGSKLSAVPNCPFITLGTKLSVFNVWCHIVCLHSWCQIVHGAKLSTVPNCLVGTAMLRMLNQNPNQKCESGPIQWGFKSGFRAWRDFSISKILMRIRLISSRSPISKYLTWKKISWFRLEPWYIDKKNLVLVSNPEILRKKSRSCLEPWDIDKKSRSRLEPWDIDKKKSRSRLETWDIDKKILFSSRTLRYW